MRADTVIFNNLPTNGYAACVAIPLICDSQGLAARSIPGANYTLARCPSFSAAGLGYDRHPKGFGKWALARFNGTGKLASPVPSGGVPVTVTDSIGLTLSSGTIYWVAVFPNGPILTFDLWYLSNGPVAGSASYYAPPPELGVAPH